MNAVAASAAGVAAGGVAFAGGRAVGFEAAGLCGVPGLMMTSGGAPAWPPKRSQAGLPERSNQRLISVSMLIR